METRYNAGKRVAWIGILTNILLLIIKLLIGFSAASQAMIADGFNSVGDVFASVITLAGSIYAAKPKDKDHAWGHGKAEYIASLLIGFSMIAMAIFTIKNSVTALIAKEQLAFSSWLVAVAIITIATKGILYLYTNRLAKQFDSLLIEANAIDHRNDVFVTIGTLIAILLSLIGQYWVDAIVGILISVWIIYSGYTILKESTDVLMDTNVAKDRINTYKNEIQKVSGIDHIDSVEAKPIGAKYLLVVKVSVYRNLSVLESHNIGKEIENNLKNKFVELEDVVVHINPDLPHE